MGGAFEVPLFLLRWTSLIDPSQWGFETLETPQYSLSILSKLRNIQVVNICLPIKVPRGQCCAKHAEQSQMQLGRHWGTHGELGNTLRTHWELNGEAVRTWWKQEKSKKSNSIVAIPHWLTKIYISTWVHHLFWPMLMAGAWHRDMGKVW
jgi:hypothetical protein